MERVVVNLAFQAYIKLGLVDTVFSSEKHSSLLTSPYHHSGACDSKSSLSSAYNIVVVFVVSMSETL